MGDGPGQLSVLTGAWRLTAGDEHMPEIPVFMTSMGSMQPKSMETLYGMYVSTVHTQAAYKRRRVTRSASVETLAFMKEAPDWLCHVRAWQEVEAHLQRWNTRWAWEHMAGQHGWSTAVWAARDAPPGPVGFAVVPCAPLPRVAELGSLKSSVDAAVMGFSDPATRYACAVTCVEQFSAEVAAPDLGDWNQLLTRCIMFTHAWLFLGICIECKFLSVEMCVIYPVASVRRGHGGYLALCTLALVLVCSNHYMAPEVELSPRL